MRDGEASLHRLPSPFPPSRFHKCTTIFLFLSLSPANGGWHQRQRLARNRDLLDSPFFLPFPLSNTWNVSRFPFSFLLLNNRDRDQASVGESDIGLPFFPFFQIRITVLPFPLFSFSFPSQNVSRPRLDRQLAALITYSSSPPSSSQSSNALDIHDADASSLFFLPSSWPEVSKRPQKSHYQ